MWQCVVEQKNLGHIERQAHLCVGEFQTRLERHKRTDTASEQVKEKVGGGRGKKRIEYRPGKRERMSCSGCGEGEMLDTMMKKDSVCVWVFERAHGARERGSGRRVERVKEK